MAAPRLSDNQSLTPAPAVPSTSPWLIRVATSGVPGPPPESDRRALPFSPPSAPPPGVRITVLTLSPQEPWDKSRQHPRPRSEKFLDQKGPALEPGSRLGAGVRAWPARALPTTPSGRSVDRPRALPGTTRPHRTRPTSPFLQLENRSQVSMAQTPRRRATSGGSRRRISTRPPAPPSGYKHAPPRPRHRPPIPPARSVAAPGDRRTERRGRRRGGGGREGRRPPRPQPTRPLLHPHPAQERVARGSGPACSPDGFNGVPGWPQGASDGGGDGAEVRPESGESGVALRRGPGGAQPLTGACPPRTRPSPRGRACPP